MTRDPFRRMRIEELTKAAGNSANFVGSLQELCIKAGAPAPVYTDETLGLEEAEREAFFRGPSVDGDPPHRRPPLEFKATVTVGALTASAICGGKAKAKRKAAAALLADLVAARTGGRQ